MCDTLLALRRGVSGYAAAFDAALLSGAQAAVAVEAATAIEAMMANVKAKAAARLAETRAFTGAGERSAASHLAQRTGSTRGQAAQTLATGQRLKDLPVLDAAARSGQLSALQTAAIADAATADPSSEARLVAQAPGTSLAELRAECARTKAAACPDLEARRRAIHARRYLRDFTDEEGAWHLHMRNNPEVGAELMAALDPIRDRLFNAARLGGRREPLCAYAADALVEAVCADAHADQDADANGKADGSTHGNATTDSNADADHNATTDGNADGNVKANANGNAEGKGYADTDDHPKAGTDAHANGNAKPDGGAARATPARPTRPRAKVLVRIDLPALLRGYPVRGETCEIAGFGPVAVSAVRDLMDTGDAFLAAVVTSGQAVVGVAHLGRRPTAAQRTALEWLYPTCAVEGCTTTARLEIDHRVDWADSHQTVFDLLDRLCTHHHHRKTLDGWALVDGRGKRAFVAPDDPRHPRHAAGSARPPPGRAHDPPRSA